MGRQDAAYSSGGKTWRADSRRDVNYIFLFLLFSVQVFELAGPQVSVASYPLCFFYLSWSILGISIGLHNAKKSIPRRPFLPFLPPNESVVNGGWMNRWKRAALCVVALCLQRAEGSLDGGQTRRLEVVTAVLEKPGKRTKTTEHGFLPSHVLWYLFESGRHGTSSLFFSLFPVWKDSFQTSSKMRIDINRW